jgi:predicted Zn-ribbon and HTH transcriptional regulator
MASESTEDESVRISLPTELGAWLDERATDLDVDRETLLRQLLASYRTTVELDGPVDADDLPVVFGDEAAIEDQVSAAVDAALEATLEREVRTELEAVLEDEVEAAVQEVVEAAVQEKVEASLQEEVETAVADEVRAALEDEVGDLIQSRVADAVEAALADRFETTPAAVLDELEPRIDSLEQDVDGKIQDVRERVIQVKREADSRAPADHSHDDLERIDGIVTRLAEVESAVGRLEEDLEEETEDREEAVAAVAEQLDDVQDRLQTVAWVVTDLREAQENKGAIEAVDRIKRAAAELDVERAKCENCGSGVNIGLLTEPNCPHCDATVTNVEDASGFFGKPRLLAASQLESGE